MKWRWREAERESMDGMGNSTTKRHALPPFPPQTAVVAPSFFLYDDPLNYGLNTMTRSDVSVVVKTTVPRCG